MNERDAAIARIAVLEEEKESWSAEDDRMEQRIATLTEALNTASCDMSDVRNALIRTEQALGGAQVRLCAVIAGYNTEEGK
jgi:chromosome segregation ATPase